MHLLAAAVYLLAKKGSNINPLATFTSFSQF